TLRTEQRMDGSTPYLFHRPGADQTEFVPKQGRRAPTRPTGMVHAAYRTSHDACSLPLHVADNLALASAITRRPPVPAAVNAAYGTSAHLADRARDAGPDCCQRFGTARPHPHARGDARGDLPRARVLRCGRSRNLHAAVVRVGELACRRVARTYRARRPARVS